MKLDESVIQKIVELIGECQDSDAYEQKDGSWKVEEYFNDGIFAVYLRDLNLVVKPGDSSQSILVDLKDVL